MGPPLFGTGFIVILSSIMGFLLMAIGPKSDLWWPDRPGGPLDPGVILKIGIPLGIILIIAGLVTG